MKLSVAVATLVGTIALSSAAAPVEALGLPASQVASTSGVAAVVAAPPVIPINTKLVGGVIQADGWTGDVAVPAGGGVVASFNFVLPAGHRLVLEKTAAGPQVLFIKNSAGQSVAAVDDPIAISASAEFINGSWRVSGNTAQLYLSSSSAQTASFSLNAGAVSSTSAIFSLYEEDLEAGRTFIPIIRGYNYNPNLGTLNDYCTKSPDRWGRADFRGPCSYHDNCYRIGTRSKHTCNVSLQRNLETNCKYAYGASGYMVNNCFTVAAAYYAVVSVANP